MVKADRYTADGCEELNKAREAETEDKRYNIGEISQKTGLQKTANGWRTPKGAGKAKSGAKPAGEKWKENTDSLGRKRISMETPQGGKVSIYESDNPKQKNARFRVDTGSHYNEFNTMEEAKAFAEKHYGVKNDPGESNAENKVKKIDNIDLALTVKPALKPGIRYEDLTREQKIKTYKYIVGLPENATVELTDSAPRILTGDCKVRIRKA